MEESIYSEASADLSAEPETDIEGDGDAELSARQMREEYQSLISGKYKRFYAEDTQKMINKRFRKYKELEEQLRVLESEKADFEERLKREKEQSAREAQQALISSIKNRRLRPGENGIFGAPTQRLRDVSSLSKSDRAEMARRASRGETITI